MWYCRQCLGYKDVRDVDITRPGQEGVFVGREKPEKCPSCGGSDLEQDPDVLDTWFSSWLWPFSTMGWPEENRTLDVFYPTQALVTAQEIIFFWVARMIMAGLKFQGGIPFRDVYIHGTVRDATGTKMSKSLGNVIDPLDIIAEVGSDALRFSMISITSQGQDVFLSKEKFDIGRNFANKIWNASRYVLMNLDERALGGELEYSSLGLAERWILHNLNKAAGDVTESLEKYRFNDAAGHLYEFIWHKYCDWYLEISKLSSDKNATQKVLIVVLKKALQLLHPIMPFITEEIWQMVPGAGCEWIMMSEWPLAENEYTDEAAYHQMEKLIRMITAIRNIRAFWNVGPKAVLDVFFSSPDAADPALIENNAVYLEKLALCRIAGAGADIERPQRSVAALVDTVKLYIPLGNAVDIETERKRVDIKIQQIEKFLSGLEKKLSNKTFLDKAPRDVVEKEMSKREKFRGEIDNLKDNLAALV